MAKKKLRHTAEQIDEAVDKARDFSNSPEFTGTPKVPTAPTATSTTQIASTQFVQQEIDRRANQFSFTVGAGQFVLAKVESITSIL